MVGEYAVSGELVAAWFPGASSILSSVEPSGNVEDIITQLLWLKTNADQKTRKVFKRVESVFEGENVPQIQGRNNKSISSGLCRTGEILFFSFFPFIAERHPLNNLPSRHIAEFSFMWKHLTEGRHLD